MIFTSQSGAVTVRPALALGSWVAFKQTDDTTAMLMGDLVLVESEVGPVIDDLQRGGIEQTALHNQLAQVLGVHSRANGGVYQVGVPRGRPRDAGWCGGTAADGRGDGNQPA